MKIMPATPNPPAAVTRSAELRNNVVHLACPHELPEGEWDGPIYARLREPRHIRPGDDCPFITDDSSRHPGWLCQLIFYPQAQDDPQNRPNAIEHLAATDVVIPYTRLTRPQTTLSRELRERPLLLLYRFVRFRSCYMAAGVGPDSNKLVEVPLPVFVLGQVVSYTTASHFTFATQSGAALRLSSEYVCAVAVRQPASEAAVNVILPCALAWESKIPRDEFVVGWCHKVPESCRPARRSVRFRSRWSELVLSDLPDEGLSRLLVATFVPTGSDTTVDFGTTPISMVTEFGRLISVTPLAYARQYIGPIRASDRVDSDVESDSESPDDILAVGFSRGRRLQPGFPEVACLATPPTITLPGGRSLLLRPLTVAPSSDSSPSHPPVSDTDMGSTALQRDMSTASAPPSVPPAEPAALSNSSSTSDALIAALTAFTQTTQQMLASQAATQRLLEQQFQQTRHALVQNEGGHPPPPSVLNPRSPTTDSRALRGAGGRCRGRSRDSSPARRHRRSRSRDRAYRDRSRSDASSPEGRPRTTSDDPGTPFPPAEPRSLREVPMPHLSSSYRDRPPVGYRGSPQRVSARHYSDPEAHPRAYAHDWSCHSAHDGRQRPERSPERQLSSLTPASGHAVLQQTLEDLMSGATTFRPPPMELRVHQTAHVGPRPQGKYIKSMLESFWRLSVLDRVCELHHHEMVRNRYRVTKVTAKMLFAVNFGTRQLDHFLPPPAQSGGSRAVVHDPATWSSADTSPPFLIRSISDLRATLHRIQEAATEWYPQPVADVFRVVYTDAQSSMFDDAPPDLVHGVVNLYSHAFSELFRDISEAMPAESLVGRVRGIIAHDSDSYDRLVRHVIEQALISTWARRHSVDSDRGVFSRTRFSREPRRSALSVLPPTIASAVPVRDGRPVCLRFQTAKGCDFKHCKHAHVLCDLPAEVRSYLIEKHGELRQTQPGNAK